MSFSIIGTGSALPKTVQNNKDLAQFLDTSNEWIVSRTGIESRHICVAESTLEIALKASFNALENAQLKPEEIDLIICPTLGGDTVTPSLACLLQEKLAASCPCFDLNAACSGFVYGLDVADAYFSRNQEMKILVVAVDAMSKFVNWQDRSTAVLFGDGAGAVVLSSGNDLKAILLTAVGNQHALSIPWPKGNHPLTENQVKPLPYLKMDGPEVYRFAVSAICKDLRTVSAQAGLKLTEIDYIIPHQANLRIIEGAAKRLKIPIEKFVLRVNNCGNTSAASIPLVLDELNRNNVFKPGTKIALTAFGGGLTTGACIIEWS
ncbi:beta-ketoacyl-ACP synthase III [Acetobacterium woodii]|uniref:Beta-ketoacyl-[acyl-carrier-protein] synthase III n=1 Tax=Acetobacterium woodii (strain ATCC 29683 / DSM 1030 / JCM 2381 / KCTC 1655 / WB1) TaxID=931626 RepID=H6LJD7_ACEWD|nr:beta-ketoacyl-ACP synthase III [Acetobacterium woodii]AFA48700.1 3-oxoacyl-[acyl-carrier-protein] synthase FabH [Acetobacterium woodii DSM 1030]